MLFSKFITILICALVFTPDCRSETLFVNIVCSEIKSKSFYPVGSIGNPLTCFVRPTLEVDSFKSKVKNLLNNEDQIISTSEIEALYIDRAVNLTIMPKELKNFFFYLI